MNHLDYMQVALDLAEKGQYNVHPNPMVGCVIVKNGQIIGQGFHEQTGSPHAEVHALQEAGAKAEAATVYVNLEPCCHFGLTPPCTNALIKAKIKSIYIAATDPNPLVAGQGIAKLKAAGIKVHTGLLETEAQKLNRVFSHYIQTQTPYILGKWAMSLDGQMAVHPSDNRMLSSNESLEDLHLLRQRWPAILIGAETARRDNPSLTVRQRPIIRQPQRIVLNAKADLPTNLNLFDGRLPGFTWLVCSETAKADFPKSTTEVIRCPTKNGQLDLAALMQILGKLKISGILVEGGRTVLNSLFQANLVNEVLTYVTPWIIANRTNKISVSGLEDVILNGIIK